MTDSFWDQFAPPDMETGNEEWARFPKVGDIVAGTVKKNFAVASKFRDEKDPAVALDTGEVQINVVGNKKQLRDELIKAAPAVGDYLSIERLEDKPSKKGYNPMQVFEVKVTRAAMGSPNNSSDQGELFS